MLGKRNKRKWLYEVSISKFPRMIVMISVSGDSKPNDAVVLKPIYLKDIWSTISKWCLVYDAAWRGGNQWSQEAADVDAVTSNMK
jgi:hypothetical protein